MNAAIAPCVLRLRTQGGALRMGGLPHRWLMPFPENLHPERASARSRRTHRRACSTGKSGALYLAQVTGDVVARPHLAHRRLLDLAAWHDIGAAGVEAASRGRVDRAWHIARQDDPLPLRIRV